MDQIRRQFLSETEDLLEQILADLDELREKRDDGRLRRQLIDGIFRRAHRIKGSAASFGFDELGEIAHDFESMLGAVRAGRPLVSDDMLDTCERAVQAMSENLNLVTSGNASRHSPLSESEEIPATRDTLSADSQRILNDVLTPIWPALTAEEKLRLAEAVAEGSHLRVATASFDSANFQQQFIRLKEKLAAHGDVISTAPTGNANRPDKINFKILFASHADVHEVEADLVGFRVGITEGESAINVSQATAHGETDMPLALRLTPASSPSHFIRTDLDELDKLISSTHELLRLTASALNLTLSQAAIGKRVRRELEKLDVQILRSFKSVEDELIGLRMVSLGPVFQRAARAGRAAARLNNKEIDFEIAGADLRVDKLLRDAIADPLVHLVRNAVDHGIEDADARTRTGKMKRGVVRIEGSNHGSQTRIRVIDDGRGIDTDTISQVAAKNGIIDEGVNLDMARSVRLIFRPGFSSRSSVSTTSGRGVGLDVVETAVEHVGGEVRVKSDDQRGTTFEIRLPVSFGLLRATVISSASNRYCIDASRVLQTREIDASQIVTTEEGDILRSEGELISLIRMRELLGQPSDEAVPLNRLALITFAYQEESGDEALNGLKRIGIVVDRIERTEEVLVRSLGCYAARWPGVGGATQLRDGVVALILDLPRLLQTRGSSEL